MSGGALLPHQLRSPVSGRLFESILRASPTDERKGSAFPVGHLSNPEAPPRYGGVAAELLRNLRKGKAFPLIGRHSRENNGNLYITPIPFLESIELFLTRSVN